ncbi:MAG: glycosyltransferase [Deltaproteobacteria bacterium]|nr:MAG: glycosyltransferase [Deltaproteobacteria bacterium]
MKVSVIIPTYNRGELLEQAIDSVLRQSIDCHEIIVVDDGSMDDTPERIKSYGEKIRYIRTRNGGPAHARNIGMRMARGEYIAFLDSDDLYYPYKLEVQTRLLDLYPTVAMVYTEFSGFDDEGYWEKDHLRTYHKSAYRSRNVTYGSIFSESVDLLRSGILPESLSCSEPDLRQRRAYFGNIFDACLLNTIVFTNSMMFRRDILPKVGWQNESFPFFEEMEFALRICRQHNVAFLDIPTYKLRYHPGQISSTATRKESMVAIKTQQYLLRAVKKHAFMDPNYYESHRVTIDRQLARLHRAVAVPLMSHEGKSAHTRKYFPKRARRYLAKCKQYGHPEYFLWAVSYGPPMIRRIAFAAMSILKK